MKKYHGIIILSAVFISFCVGWLSRFEQDKNLVQRTTQVRDNTTPYQFIRPLILVDNSGSNFPQLDPLKTIINSDVSAAEQSKNASDVSVYYRDMITGAWTGVNQNDTYAPSSMLKVGVLMSYLKIAETNPDILSEKLTYTPQDDSGQYYKPKQLPTGEYTVQDLLIQMIQQSDNDALISLVNAEPQGLIDVFSSLSIPYPSIATSSIFISPIDYSRIFRTLYNATYLPDITSEQTLQLLTTTDFNQGLLLGVTPTTVVAHKFGEQTNTAANGTVTDRELHDCGIVYYPNHPYFLCVMTKGQNFPALSKIIGNISKSVFDYVSTKYPS